VFNEADKETKLHESKQPFNLNYSVYTGACLTLH